MLPPTPNPLSAPPTPLTRPRSSSEQMHSINTPYQQYEQTKPINNVDDLAAYLKDPTNIYLPVDVTSVSDDLFFNEKLENYFIDVSLESIRRYRCFGGCIFRTTIDRSTEQSC